MNPEAKLQTVIEELRDSSTEVKLYTLWDTIGYFQLKNDPEVDSEGFNPEYPISKGSLNLNIITEINSRYIQQNLDVFGTFRIAH